MNTKRYFEDIGAWPRSSHKLLRIYTLGFVLALAMTLAAYFLAVNEVLPQSGAFAALLVFACAQFVVQIMCFLHLGRGAASRERLIALSCAVLIVLILVVGSIWIMFHLNERMMADPQQMQAYMNSEQGI